MRIGVFGTGHVGLITCVTLAAVGHDVVGTELEDEKIDMLSRRVTPFFEPGVDGRLSAGVGDGKLGFRSR